MKIKRGAKPLFLSAHKILHLLREVQARYLSAKIPFAPCPRFFCLPGSLAIRLRCSPYQPQPASRPLCFSARHPPTLCFATPGKPCLVLKTRRNIFPPLPSPLPQGERKNIY